MSNSQNSNSIRIFMVDSVGAHRGMHYYNFAYVSALNKAGANAFYLSTDETTHHPLRPANVPTRTGFTRIYGGSPKLWRGLWYAASLLRIARLIREERPDVVHFHFFQIPQLDYLFLNWLNSTGTATAATVHDILPFSRGSEIKVDGNNIYRRIYHRINGLVLNSKHAWNTLQEFDERLLVKSVYIPHGNFSGISAGRLIPKNRARVLLELESDGPIILVFGTIKPNKRLDLVIEATAAICQKYPDARLVVAGKPRGQDVSGFFELAKECGVTENVVWRLEFITDEQVAWYFSAADVVVFPYQWIYQSGALLMAMSFGKPVVATAVGSNVEFIENHKTGLLVPLDAPSAMAQAILTVLDNPDRAAEMGRAAAEYVEVELAWDKIARTTLDFYQQIMETMEHPL